ncbi:MFS transporter [Kitasatospora griseola]|uniref:MFS transporter n=1 Tax=Kitasatospora griseola TaxID=2064 RepID=UPI0036DF1AA8
MTHAYRDCLGSPHAKYLFTTNLLGRLPNGMAPLGIAIFLRSHHFGFGTVGLITALYGLSTAIGGPLLGRAVDRFGQPAVLAPSALGSAAGLLWLMASGGRSAAAAAGAVCVAGLFSPPLEPCLRTLWPSMLADPRAIAAAFALDASLQEVVFVSGPLLVVLTSAVLSPGAVLPLTALAMLVGTAGYLLPEPVRRWRAEPRRPDWAGPLRSSVLRRLLLTLGCIGIGLGALNIAMVAYQEHVGRPGLSGVLLGANALGALIGGLVYGARSWPLPVPRRLVLLLAASAVCYLPLVVDAPPLPTTVLVFCAGLFLAPILTCGFSIIGEVAPRGTATEAFAWMVTAVLTGNAAGSSLAGLTRQQVDLWAVLLIPGLAMLVATLAATTVGRGPTVPTDTASLEVMNR